MLLYGETQTTFSEPGLILEFQIPPDHAYKCTSFIGWGDTPGEFEIYKNEDVIAGCRTSPESRTVQVWWGSPVMLDANDVLSVLATHYSQGLKRLKANIMLDRV